MQLISSIFFLEEERLPQFPQHGQFSVPMRHKFPKAEHLCLKRDIDQLFTAGTRSAVSFPLRAIVRTRPHDGKFPRVQVLISVAKRRLRHAVDRNRAKRQIREAYRLNKEIVWEQLPEGVAVHLGLVWVADQPQDSALVQKRLVGLLHRVVEKIAPSISEKDAEISVESATDLSTSAMDLNTSATDASISSVSTTDASKFSASADA